MPAISSFSLEAGTSTFCCRARIALRIRASMSATGSVKFIVYFSSAIRSLREPENLRWLATLTYLVIPRRPLLPLEDLCACRDWPCLVRRLTRAIYAHPYQDDFETPGISPRNASPRKHRRQIPNLRRNARGRPQMLQRLCRRVENLGLGSFLSRAC